MARGDSFEGIFDERQLLLWGGGNPQLSDDVVRESSLFIGYLDHMKIFQNKSNLTTKELIDRMGTLGNSVYASSFHINSEPSRYMLGNYGHIAVKTSIDLLETELGTNGRLFQTGLIEYISDSWTPIPEVSNAVMFYKLDKYIHEREFRIFTIDKGYYNASDPNTYNTYIDAELPCFVTGIYINPAMDTNERKRLEKMTRDRGLKVLHDSLS